MAATALLTIRPFDSFAKYALPLTGTGFNHRNIVLLHTSGPGFRVVDSVKKIKNKTANLVLLHAGNNIHEESQELNYDASPSSLNKKFTDPYQIVFKGDIKVGIITANYQERDLVNRMNSLSAFLKKDKQCDLVICLSQLGYKNRHSMDDITLAGKSESIDVIIGKHALNSPKQPVTVANRNREEVIIRHTADNETAIGTIRIDFNKLGNKSNISF